MGKKLTAKRDNKSSVILFSILGKHSLDPAGYLEKRLGCSHPTAIEYMKDPDRLSIRQVRHLGLTSREVESLYTGVSEDDNETLKDIKDMKRLITEIANLNMRMAKEHLIQTGGDVTVNVSA